MASGAANQGACMSKKQIFIFGAGYSGKAFARAAKDVASIFGTTRSPDKFEALRQAGIAPLLFDGPLTGEIGDALRKTTHLVISVAPEEAGDPVLNAARAMIARMPTLEWIGYLSTVGVYGNYDGAWVDETAECRPVSKRSVMRVAAEQDWLKLGREIGQPVAILRLSGIYGPGRNALVNLENGTARRLVKPDQVFNRIHCDDIAGALWQLVEGNTGGVFNVTDDLPAPPQDVVAYAASLMGVEPPPEIPFDAAQLSPMARSFYGENKRVANAAIKAAGYSLRFPDYRAAFDHMWASGDWRDGEARSPMKR
jgi:nucleoside-diphosphate-sugar epimerase